MPVFTSKDFDSHSQIVFINEPSCGLKAIIAVHNTNRGPALGGCRMWDYGSEEEALRDVLRLSRGMTYKAAMANLPLGGGKAVIFGDSKTHKTPELLKAFANHVEHLQGVYITAEDVGMNVRDMDIIRSVTSHVVGLDGGTVAGGSGDPSRMTAYGVFQGIRATIKHRFNRENLEGLTIAVQGLGSVGYTLCQHIKAAGANLVVTDIYPQAVERVVREFNATAVLPEDIFTVEADVLAPCALGGILNDTTIPQLKVKAVAGATNNQLGERRHGQMLADRGILYAPDYIINAGGLINVTYEGESYDQEKVLKHVAGIYDTLLEVYAGAERDGLTTNVAADQIAETRFKR
jgi:leucine dehydrogenase